MTELFELIASKPLEFLAGLGISSTAIYSLYSLFRFLLGLITKKSKKKKEIIQQNKIADFVIKKLISSKEFFDALAIRVIEAFDKSHFKKMLEEITKKENCPIELKAYIETILGQVGNEDLFLLYEQTKSFLISNAKEYVKEIVDKGEELLDKEKSDVVIQEDIKPGLKDEEIKEEPQSNDEVEIDYA